MTIEKPTTAAYASKLADLGLDLLRRKKYADAEPSFRECLDIREKLLKENEVSAAEVASARSMLGEAFLAGKKPADAGNGSSSPATSVSSMTTTVPVSK